MTGGAANRPTQLAFDLAPRPALEAEDFLVGPSNATAIGLIDQWPDWPHWAVVIQGAARSGKSHLGSVWRYRSGAVVAAADGLTPDLPARMAAAGALLIENLERGVNDEALGFHLLNLAREHRHAILFTSRIAPGDLSIALPDLRSRLRALPVAVIAPPDDALLQAVLVKHFADRQLTVEPAVVSYLALHIERSFAAAHAVVESIDRRSLADKRRVTRALAQDVIRSLQSVSQDSDAASDPKV